MKFRIGSHVVTLSITHRRVPEGKLALAKHSTHEILIAARVAPGLRHALLLHELRHCWGWWVPMPANEEDEARLLSLIASTAEHELAEQGGRAALEALAPSDEPLPDPELAASLVRSRHAHKSTHENTHSASGGTCVAERRVVPLEDPFADEEAVPAPGPGRASAQIIHCTVCRVALPGGVAATSDPMWSIKAGGVVVIRRIYCPRCDHIQKWEEGATPDGTPNGVATGRPTHHRSGYQRRLCL
jgi:hypothetical protein